MHHWRLQLQMVQRLSRLPQAKFNFHLTRETSFGTSVESFSTFRIGGPGNLGLLALLFFIPAMPHGPPVHFLSERGVSACRCSSEYM